MDAPSEHMTAQHNPGMDMAEHLEGAASELFAAAAIWRRADDEERAGLIANPIALGFKRGALTIAVVVLFRIFEWQAFGKDLNEQLSASWKAAKRRFDGPALRTLRNHLVAHPKPKGSELMLSEDQISANIRLLAPDGIRAFFDELAGQIVGQPGNLSTTFIEISAHLRARTPCI